MKVLIIHATAGAGHKKAAEGIYNGIKETNRHDATLVDALDYTNPLFRKTYPTTYEFLVTKVPFVWKFFFGLLDIPALQPLVRIGRRIYNGFNASRLQDYLKKEQFDCIVTTQFLSAEVTAYLKRTGQIKSKIVCVVTDFDVHRIWLNKGIDVYTGATEFTREKLIKLGVSPEKVFVTGIPTDHKFAEATPQKDFRQKLGIDTEAFTVLIATGSFGMGPIEGLMEELKDHQLLVVCGYNKSLYERLSAKKQKGAVVYGLVNNMHELMGAADVMVSKPGGLSIAEALVKGLPLIFFQAIPGQETQNVHVLKHYGVCEGILGLPEIREQLARLSADRTALKSLREKARSLAKPDAVDKIIALIQ